MSTPTSHSEEACKVRTPSFAFAGYGAFSSYQLSVVAPRGLLMSSKPSSSAQALHRPAHLTLIAAQVASAACERKAQEINMPMNIAIVDTSLYLLHFTRMPGAKLTSIDISQSKAFTAAGHRNPTSSYKDMVWPGGAAFGLNSSNGGKFMYVGGGLPIKVDGECVGAIGCSNGTPAQDAEVAQAGVDAVQEMVKKSRQAKL